MRDAQEGQGEFAHRAIVSLKCLHDDSDWAIIRSDVGVWRSPVARFNGVEEAQSSNLCTPT